MIAVEANPFTSLSAAVGTGAGLEWPAAGYVAPAVQVEGIVAGDTVDVESSINGADWVVVGSTITADGLVVLAAGPGLWRANLTAIAGGGAVTAVFLGH